jgi:hypothetical protein
MMVKNRLPSRGKILSMSSHLKMIFACDSHITSNLISVLPRSRVVGNFSHNLTRKKYHVQIIFLKWISSLLSLSTLANTDPFLLWSRFIVSHAIMRGTFKANTSFSLRWKILVYLFGIIVAARTLVMLMNWPKSLPSNTIFILMVNWLYLLQLNTTIREMRQVKSYP